MFFEGFTEFQHLKSITKPKFSLQQHLALQRDNLPEMHFKRKYSCAHYLYKGTLGTFWTLCYDSYRAGLFLTDFWHSQIHGHS